MDRMPWEQVEGACRGCGRTDCYLVKQWKSEAAYQDCLAHTIARLERAAPAKPVENDYSLFWVNGGTNP